jgi:hypothetical protein
MEQVRYDFARHFYEKSWKKAPPVLETKGQNEKKTEKEKSEYAMLACHEL